MIETFPLADVSAAYECMIANKARFRVVLSTE
jgi:D-arabinose 1-dehydrogenase-like Zn-dependent alcohol dehydrogenase